MAGMQQLVMGLAMLPEGQTLRAMMTVEQRATYETALAKLDTPAEAFDRFEPWYAGMMLSLLPLIQNGYSPESGVEKVLEQQAGERARTGLETVEYQMALFDTLPVEAQFAFLMEAAGMVDTLKPMIDAMVIEWLEGDADALAVLMNEGISDPALIERLLHDRNRNWAQWIEGRLEQPGTVFVAVGAGHLAGDESVQDVLGRQGVTVHARFSEGRRGSWSRSSRCWSRRAAAARSPSRWPPPRPPCGRYGPPTAPWKAGCSARSTRCPTARSGARRSSTVSSHRPICWWWRSPIWSTGTPSRTRSCSWRMAATSRPFAQRVDPSRRDALATALADASLDEDAAAGLETWAVALMLARNVRLGESGNGVDRALIGNFTGRPVRELEGALAQLTVFDALPESEQRDLLAAVLDELARGRTDPRALVEAWVTGDLDALVRETQTGLLSDPELREALLTGRNRDWAEKLARLLAQPERPLVAVGAGHLAGPDALPSLLADRGFVLERVQ